MFPGPGPMPGPRPRPMPRSQADRRRTPAWVRRPPAPGRWPRPPRPRPARGAAGWGPWNQMRPSAASAGAASRRAASPPAALPARRSAGKATGSQKLWAGLLTQTPFFIKRHCTSGLMSCQAWESSGWDRDIIGSFIGPRHYVSERFAVSGEQGPGGSVGSVAERDGSEVQWGINRSEALAAARGGARAGKPRWVRVLVITGGCSMAAMIIKVPPQGKQFSIAEALARQQFHEAFYDARE